MVDEFDAVVVGAGILGVSSAYHILESAPGSRVLLVESLADAGQANTGRSNAMFRNTFTSVDNQLLSNSSIDFYTHVQSELGVDVGVDPIGYLWLMSEAQLSAAQAHLRKMERNGVEVRRFDQAEISRRIPGIVTKPSSTQSETMTLPAVSAGLFGPKCGRLAPERLVGFYKSRFLALGGRVLFSSRAESLIVEPTTKLGIDGEPFVWQDHRISGVRLADGKEVRSKTVVVACGAWENELLDPIGIDGHAKAKKRQLFALNVGGADSGLRRLLWAGGFNASGTLPFVILPKASLFIKPVKESHEFWLGCEDEINRPFISFPERDLEQYRAEPAYYEYNIQQILREYLPQFEGVRPSRMWAGLYSYNTLDNMPYVFGDHEGLIVVGGDSGSGVMKGDSLGRVVAAVYADGPTAEAKLYGGVHYRASKLSFSRRDVEREEWVL